MFLEDYGLWFSAYVIDKDSQGRVMLGGAWKTPVINLIDLPIGPRQPCTKIISTDDVKELETACTESGWGFVLVRNCGEGLLFLVENVKDISHAKIFLLLNSTKIKKLDIKLAKRLESAVLNNCGKPTIDGITQDEESILRNLYYKKFGIKLP